MSGHVLPAAIVLTPQPTEAPATAAEVAAAYQQELELVAAHHAAEMAVALQELAAARRETAAAAADKDAAQARLAEVAAAAEERAAAARQDAAAAAARSTAHIELQAAELHRLLERERLRVLELETSLAGHQAEAESARSEWAVEKQRLLSEAEAGYINLYSNITDKAQDVIARLREEVRAAPPQSCLLCRRWLAPDT
jgi:hypothetical protein